MKKILIGFICLLIITTFGCKKNNPDDNGNNNNNNQNTNQDIGDNGNNNNNNQNTNQDIDDNKLDLTFNQDNYYYGDTFSYTSTKYTNNELYLTVDDENALDKNDDGTYTVRRYGIYNVKIAVKMDPSISYTKEFHFYRTQFEIETTSDKIMIGDNIDVRVFSFDDLYETSDDDFIYSVDDSSIAEINNHSLIGKNYGNVKVTLTSKTNPKVTSSRTIKVCNPDTEFVLKPVDGTKTIATGESISFYFSLDYKVDEYIWSSSNKEVLRVTKYDTAAEVTGVGPGEAYVICYLKSNPTIKSSYLLKVNEYNGVDYIDKLIKLAYEQVGIVEGKDDQGRWNNEQKFGIWYGNNGQPWCATFVSWCWFHAGLSNEIMVKYQGCYAGMEWAHEHGIFHDITGDYYTKEKYEPKSGDLVMFLSDGWSHTGIVGYADDTYIYTIEGNRSNRVDIWRIKKTHASITGYVSPQYPEPTERKDQSWLKTTMVDGHYLWTDTTTGQSTT